MSGPEHEKQIFLAALERPTPAEREAFLREACADDSGLFQRLQVLIAMHDQSLGPLDQPPSDPALELTRAQAAAETVGMAIGPYKLREQIGEGGFGVVYVAEQEQPVARKVALKIIKPGMDTREVIARFEAERQALALMDHPHIAKVLDAGTTNVVRSLRERHDGSRSEPATFSDPGRPYFVMELVHGLPITQFCDEHKLTNRGRLQLFVDVCRAVQHAHQKGIIHRDLKPSNILVALDGDRPVPKVIDFGISAEPEVDRQDGLHRLRADGGDAPLHGARAGGPESARCRYAERRVFAGSPAVRTADGHHAVRRGSIETGRLRRNAADHPRGRATQTQ